ncbi:hypothetical protein V8C37DRAFT_386338 [Trichoderma ceciliae]
MLLMLLALPAADILRDTAAYSIHHTTYTMHHASYIIHSYIGDALYESSRMGIRRLSDTMRCDYAPCWGSSALILDDAIDREVHPTHT